MAKSNQLQKIRPSFKLFWGRYKPSKPVVGRTMDRCPYCRNKNIIKHGRKQNKFQIIQYYRCQACRKMFTPQVVKHKQYPLRIILDGISFYNLGYTKTDSCHLLKEKYGLNVKPNTLSNWIKELIPLCRYARLRDQARKSFPPTRIIQSAVLNHKQVYHFRFHQAKLELLCRHRPFTAAHYQKLHGYFDIVINEYPHHYFQTEQRSSQAKINFDFNQTHIQTKQNHATRLAQLLLQAVTDNRMRHDTLQQFMLANDSVTVAMEVPVYLAPQDIAQYKNKYGFNIPFELNDVLTGHIDLLQIRNGHIHILDYKPNARREKPYAQLTLYALALSRLTNLRLMDFKCAWFDENHYFEFFPLQLVHKRKRQSTKKPPQRMV